MHFLHTKNMARYLPLMIVSASCFFAMGELQAAGIKCGDTYTVKSGDSLGVIASRAYGRSSQYPLISAANSKALKNGPKSLQVGQKLKIPCGQVAAAVAVPDKKQSAASRLDSSKTLFFAAQRDPLRNVVVLVREGADLNFKNMSGETPMHAAASAGRVDILHYLHRKGARHNLRTSNGWLPIHHAVRFGHVAAAQFLIGIGSPVHSSTGDNKTVFDMASATQNGRMINMLNQHRN